MKSLARQALCPTLIFTPSRSIAQYTTFRYFSCMHACASFLLKYQPIPRNTHQLRPSTAEVSNKIGHKQTQTKSSHTLTGRDTCSDPAGASYLPALQILKNVQRQRRGYTLWKGFAHTLPRRVLHAFFHIRGASKGKTFIPSAAICQGPAK